MLLGMIEREELVEDNDGAIAVGGSEHEGLSIRSPKLETGVENH